MALLGEKVSSNFLLSPIYIGEIFLIAILWRGIFLFLTVMRQVEVILLWVLTVIVLVPSFNPTMIPLLSTDTTLGLELE